MSTLFHNILRAAASAMEIPVVICLLLLLAFSVFSLGWWLAELLGADPPPGLHLRSAGESGGQPAGKAG